MEWEDDGRPRSFSDGQVQVPRPAAKPRVAGYHARSLSFMRGPPQRSTTMSTRSGRQSTVSISSLRAPSVISRLSSSVFRSRGMSSTTRSTVRTDAMMIDHMSTFKLTSPDILRATCAGVPLRRFGRMLRPPLCSCIRGTHGAGAANEHRSKKEAEQAFAHSFTAMRIETFWSHSWRATAWQKIMTLLVYYNGLAASLIGVLAAVAGSALFLLGILPVMFWTSSASNQDRDVQYGYACWSVLSGMIAFLSVLTCWHSNRSIFLDKVCIHQHDLRLRKEGIQSIGAFLRASDSMLVLWDPTYQRRLWCVFEVAAFVYAHTEDDGRDLNLMCRPLILGPAVFTMFCTMIVLFIVIVLVPGEILIYGAGPIGAVLLTALFAVLREYHLKLRVLRAELSTFEVKKAECFCCTQAGDHVHPETGEELICDRKLVEACIVDWFGSLESFNALVQSRLWGRFRRELGRFAIPYRLVVMGGLPTLWGYFDMVCTYWRAGSSQLAIAHLLIGLTWWLGSVPCLVALTSTLASKSYAHRWRGLPAADALLALGHGILIAALGFASWVAWTAGNRHLGEAVSTVVYIACIVVLSCVTWVPCAHRAPPQEPWETTRSRSAKSTSMTISMPVAEPVEVPPLLSPGLAAHCERCADVEAVDEEADSRIRDLVCGELAAVHV